MRVVRPGKSRQKAAHETDQNELRVPDSPADPVWAALRPGPGMNTHDYAAVIAWTGNRGEGTAHYKAYDRTWQVETPGKPVIAGSNDPRLGGDPSRPNPEDMLLAALSACHMLWYLRYASEEGLVVEDYRDEPLGVGETGPCGAGRFISATLRPVIKLSRGADLAKAEAIHHRIREVCFIARSINFPVSYAPRFIAL